MDKNEQKTAGKPFGDGALSLDPARECARIEGRLRDLLARTLHRRGLVVGLSGGIDSSVTAALAARALGPEKVLALEMPERHSAPETLFLSALVAEHLGVPHLLEDITGPLESVGFYRRFEEAVRRVIPGYDSQWASKIVLDPGTRPGFHLFTLVVRRPDGAEIRRRLPLQAYLEIVAATNFKQRLRKVFEYHHADRLHFAVAGTPNRLEYDQGFFVKGGDGAADIKPIAHLYKTQVYQLAEYLGIPEEIRRRPPTTDTYSLAQGQDEFYFSLPYREMDLCLYGHNHGIAADDVAAAAGLPKEQVEAVWAELERKRSTTRYLHLPPQLVAPVEEVGTTARIRPAMR